MLALLGDPVLFSLPADLAEHLPGIRSKAGDLLLILAGSAAMLLLGYLDDRRGLSPWTRLLVQSACAAMLAVAGIRISVFLPGEWLHGLMTVVFIVAITNAVNFIDNMNGLMGGVVAIGALHLLCLAVATQQLFLAAILICLVGGLLGFLPRNFPKARVFIGDAGSLALGFLLAALTVVFTFEEGGPSSHPVLMPLLVLLVPAADCLTVVCSRLCRGVHPFTAGHDHLSHRLVARGLNSERAVLFLWAIAFVAGIPSLLMGQVSATVATGIWVPAIGVGLLLTRFNRSSEAGS